MNSDLVSFSASGVEFRLVRHGDPFRREGSFDAGQTSSVFYRPEKHDVLVYEPAIGEIRMHAASKGEKETYRDEISLQTIRRHRKPMLRVRRHLETTAHDRAQPQLTHAPCNAILVRPPASFPQGSSDLRATGAPLAGLEQLGDFGIQSPRLLRPRLIGRRCQA